jgi:hypothetical protein
MEPESGKSEDTMDELALLDALIESHWIAVRAMTPLKRRDILLDAVFITRHGDVRLTGKAHSLKDRPAETFSLEVFQHSREGWWSENSAGATKWPARELSDEWLSGYWSLISIGPRDARFYADPLLNARSLPPKCLLDHCAAMELRSSANASRIVIAASREIPCAVEIGLDGDAGEALLAGLDPISLDAWPAIS